MKQVLINYVRLLTSDEKTLICRMITGRDFKEYFKKNEKEFTQIKKGFRAKSLSDESALSVAISNADKPFITAWINSCITVWLQEIKDNIDRLVSEGEDPDTALAVTMLDSVFVNHIDLYLKLTDQVLEDSAHIKLLENMVRVKSQKSNVPEASEPLKALEEENSRLVEQIDSSRKEYNTLKSDYEQKFEVMEQEKGELVSQLAQMQEQAANSGSLPTNGSSNSNDQLVRYNDENPSILPAIGSDETFSLCGVLIDRSEQKWLIRFADLHHDGLYSVFHRNEEIAPFFHNRDKLFYRDGPSENDFYGIWTWQATPNEKDSTKDYVVSHYNDEITAVEVVVMNHVTTLDDLINQLKDGLEYRLHSRRVMFSFRSSRGQYTGILCDSKDLSSTNGKVVFADGLYTVPVYEFAGDNLLRIANGLLFYKSAFVGIPQSLRYLKSPLDITKDIVLSSVSWSAYKTRGLTHAEYKSFRDCLDSIPVGDITKQIGVACQCSPAEAEKLLQEFLDAVLNYVNGNSIEDRIILSAISVSEELQAKTKDLIRADWESENKCMLTDAQNELELLKAQSKAAEAHLADTQAAYQKAISEEARIEEAIAAKEKLAEDVESAVSDRIRLARENAAKFIADMAFTSSSPIQISSPLAVSSGISDESCSPQYRVFDAVENLGDLEPHSTWDDVIDTAALELGEAGVAESHVRGLAAFLCAAYIQKQPILLVGPNADDIILAFSAAINAGKHGVFNCTGSYSGSIQNKIGTHGEKIVVINNLLAGNWMNMLPKILANKDIFFVATHPFAEDIQVEPKSLFGFMLPLFTEFFVNKKATGEYYGGYFSEDFMMYAPPKAVPKDSKLLSHSSLSPLVKNRIHMLLATMHDIYPDAASDDDFLFLLLPIAYATLSLEEIISNPQADLSISASLKRELEYLLGDL